MVTPLHLIFLNTHFSLYDTNRTRDYKSLKDISFFAFSFKNKYWIYDPHTLN